MAARLALAVIVALASMTTLALAQTPPGSEREPRVASLPRSKTDLTAGVQMTLDRAARGRLDVTFHNGSKAVILKLGQIQSQGTVLVPNQLQLVVTDHKGQPRKLNCRLPTTALGGEAEDYLLPLAPGAKHTLTLQLADYPGPTRQPVVTTGEVIQVVLDGPESNDELDLYLPTSRMWEGPLQTAEVVYID